MCAPYNSNSLSHVIIIMYKNNLKKEECYALNLSSLKSADNRWISMINHKHIERQEKLSSGGLLQNFKGCNKENSSHISSQNHLFRVTGQI